MKYAKNETLSDINAEVARARAKFPGNRFMLAALTEEVGELAQALLQKKEAAEIRKEAIQVACVAIRIIEEGDASFADMTDAEAIGRPPEDPERAAQRSLDRINAIRHGDAETLTKGAGPK